MDPHTLITITRIAFVVLAITYIAWDHLARGRKKRKA